MRNLTDPDIDALRDRSQYTLETFGWHGDDRGGRFFVPFVVREYTDGIGFLSKTVALQVIASSDDGWDHLSVSVPDEPRCPTWEEMEYVKRLFMKPTECAMQLHVPPAAHINNHPYTLHIWRPHKPLIPRPPRYMV
jgi:hypothetical protein